MALNLLRTVSDYLRSNAENKFTTRQIAEWIFENYPEECREKQKRSKATVAPLDTDSALVQQIAAEISSIRRNLEKTYLEIKTTEGRPRKYYFTFNTDIDEIHIAETSSDKQHLGVKEDKTISELSLYPKLAEFLYTELGVHSKRIDEKRSRNGRGPGGNKWLYPDLVGMEDLTRDWNREIKDCVTEYADKKTKLWSFEVKILVNRSNIREVFFQTVSNSSWANYGYLVASEIEGTDTLKELRMLSSLHGIGFIKIDFDAPAESQILIPARERMEVDWNTANRLVDENKDFFDYIRLIKQFYQTGDSRQKDWDYFSL